MNNSIIGGGLKRIRTEKGITLRKLHKLSGVHFVNIHQYEAGKRDPSATNIQKLAKALRVDPGDLFR